MLLTINESTTFFNSILQMGNDVKIVVPTGKTLWIDGSKLHSCDKLWAGIQVEQNGMLFSEETSFIEDAKYAVYVVDDATLNISKTTFNRNYTGIFAPFLAGTNLHNTASWTLFSNTFQCSESLRPKYDGTNIPAGAFSYAGVDVAELTQLSIVESGNSVTTFRDMKYGVKSSSTPLTITKVKFINMQPGLYGGSLAYGIYASGSASESYTLTQKGWGMSNSSPVSFQDCQTGIYAYQMNVNVRNNRMRGVYQGIGTSLENNKDVIIQNNSIHPSWMGIRLSLSTNPKSILITGNSINLTPVNSNVESYGIAIHNMTMPPTPPEAGYVQYNTVVHSGYSTGISLMNSQNITAFNNRVHLHSPATETNGIRSKAGKGNHISKNEVWGDGAALADLHSSGILAFSTPSLRMCCDTVRNSYAGVRITGMTNSPDLFLGNKFNTHKYGLHFTATGVLDKQIRKGNKWWGTYSGGKMAKHDGGLSIAEESPFIIHVDQLPYMPPSTLRDPIDGWFDLQGGAYNVCTESPLCPILIEKTALDNHVANSVFESPEHDEGMQWMGKRTLQEKLHRYPDLLGGDALLGGFYQQNAGAAVGKLVEVEVGIEEAHLLQPEDADTLDSYGASITNHIETLEKIDSALFYADTAEWTNLLAHKANEMAALNDAMEQSAQLLSEIETARSSAITQLASQNSAVSPVSIQEANEWTVNAVFLETFAQNNSQLSVEQATRLSAIASQCPLDGGNAVISARVMLEEEAYYNDDELCQAGGGERSSQNEQDDMPNDFAQLFPNPADSYLVIQMPEGVLLSEVAIVNSVGAEMLLEAKDLPAPQVLLDVSQLPQGIYTCRIFTQDKALISKKIAIVR